MFWRDLVLLLVLLFHVESGKDFVQSFLRILSRALFVYRNDIYRSDVSKTLFYDKNENRRGASNNVIFFFFYSRRWKSDSIEVIAEATSFTRVSRRENNIAEKKISQNLAKTLKLKSRLKLISLLLDHHDGIFFSLFLANDLEIFSTFRRVA